jgi:Methyltransferase domain
MNDEIPSPQRAAHWVDSVDPTVLATRHGRLNALGRLNGATRYLEVGVHKAKTLRNVQIELKTAVDPVFAFERSELSKHNVEYHEVTSDDFFAQASPALQPFDVVYLDGLHVYEQTLRDLTNALRFSHERTLVLIDDTLPVSFLAAERDQSRVRFAREFVPHEDKQWMGDVFKIIPFLHDYMPDLDWLTFPGHGQTVVFKRPRTLGKPCCATLGQLATMDFIDFLKLRKTGVFKVAESDAAVIRGVHAALGI